MGVIAFPPVFASMLLSGADNSIHANDCGAVGGRLARPTALRTRHGRRQSQMPAPANQAPIR